MKYGDIAKIPDLIDDLKNASSHYDPKAEVSEVNKKRVSSYINALQAFKEHFDLPEPTSGD